VGLLLVVVFGIFLTLKLTGTEPVSDWSWWWVSAPILFPAVIVGIAWLTAFITLVVKALK
jgi:ABC-type spermidine/putrescine transport system permease subunit II